MGLEYTELLESRHVIRRSARRRRASRVTSLWGFYVTKIRLDMELAYYDTRCKNTYVSPDNVFLDYAPFELRKNRGCYF